MLSFSDKELEKNHCSQKRRTNRLHRLPPEEDEESYALTIHGMIHHKEASWERTTVFCGLAAVEFDADLADKNYCS